MKPQKPYSTTQEAPEDTKEKTWESGDTRTNRRNQEKDEHLRAITGEEGGRNVAEGEIVWSKTLIRYSNSKNKAYV